MGISLGSSSKKPYVGSKEVTEAYVGSTLVYQSKLPDTYVFLGGTDDYYLANYATLSSAMSITKEGDKYRIFFPAETHYYPQLNINEIKGTHIKFKLKGGGNYSNVVVRGILGTTAYQIGSAKIDNADYIEYDFIIDKPNYEYIYILTNSYGNVYVDDVRFEN